MILLIDSDDLADFFYSEVHGQLITIKPDANGKFKPELIKPDGGKIDFILALDSYFPTTGYRQASEDYHKLLAGEPPVSDPSIVADYKSAPLAESVLQDNGGGSYTFLHKPEVSDFGLINSLSSDYPDYPEFGQPVINHDGKDLIQGYPYVAFRFDLSAAFPEEEPAEPANPQPGTQPEAQPGAPSEAPATGVGANLPSGLLIVPILLVGAGLVVQRRF